MIRIREFTPSEDVLAAIRSLRADDDGMEPVQGAAETSESSASAETPAAPGKAIATKYEVVSTGHYLRARA